MSAIKLSTPSSGSISLSPADTASNFTVSIPAADATMVTTAATQTLTNKTLTSPTLTSPTITGNISDGTNSTSSTNVVQGSAKAWAKFNGSGTVSASFNVSSVTVPATGVYAVNFTTAMTDVNYSYVAMSQMPTDTGLAISYTPPTSLGTNTASVAYIRTAVQNGGSTAALTPTNITVVVFR